MSKVIDIEDAIIMSRMFQYGWDEEYKKKFEKALYEALKIKSFDLEEHDRKLLDKVAERIKGRWLFRGTDGNPYRDIVDKVIEEMKAEVSENANES